MKQSIITGVLLMACVATAGCGGRGSKGGSKTPEPDKIPSSSESVTEAQGFVETGDVAQAQTSYDQALVSDPDNAQAAFGAAFTRLMTLPESDPSKKILADLGQPEFKLSNLIGPTGYLAAWDDVNKITVTLDGMTGPFYGEASSLSDYHTRYIDNIPISCRRATVSMNVTDSSRNLRLQITVYYLLESLNQDGTVRESVSVVSAGQTIAQGEKAHLAGCGYYYDEDDDNIPLIEVSGDWGLDYEGYFDDANGQGTITVSQLSTEEGGPVEVQLHNVTLTHGSEVLTLNGTVSDVITGDEPDPAQFFPLTNPRGEYLSRAELLLKNVRSGLTVTDLQADVASYVPLLEDIAGLLEKADQDDTFQFVIPKGLYFGTTDVVVNRADLKALRGAVHLALSGLYLANSWQCPLVVSGHYDAASQEIIAGDPQEMVNQLNQCFVLKADHQIDEAQAQFAQGLQFLLDAEDLRPTLTVDGILDADSRAVGGYAELKDALGRIQKSLGEEAIFPYVDPVVTVNLGHFFNTPPSIDTIDVDPFVLENGKIHPVESFFQKSLEGIVDVDLAQDYRSAFRALDEDFLRDVLDEFKIFYIAGEEVGFGEGNDYGSVSRGPSSSDSDVGALRMR